MRKLLLLFLALSILIPSACKTKTVYTTRPAVEVQDPMFEVVTIVILQADIVVTKFETVLKITNPNDFPLELSSFTYELFANNISWAKGTGKENLHIPPHESEQTNFIFDMNFTGQTRRLLDDVINMRQISYRLKGTAEVQPVVPFMKPFVMEYDRSGLSDVRRR